MFQEARRREAALAALTRICTGHAAPSLWQRALGKIRSWL